MASRCRTCGHLVPRPGKPLMPSPARLSHIALYMGDLLEVAAEYDSLDEQPTTAVEFVRWADVDIQLAAGYQHGYRRSSLAGPQR